MSLWTASSACLSCRIIVERIVLDKPFKNQKPTSSACASRSTAQWAITINAAGLFCDNIKKNESDSPASHDIIASKTSCYSRDARLVAQQLTRPAIALRMAVTSPTFSLLPRASAMLEGRAWRRWRISERSSFGTSLFANFAACSNAHILLFEWSFSRWKKGDLAPSRCRMFDTILSREVDCSVKVLLCWPQLDFTIAHRLKDRILLSDLRTCSGADLPIGDDIVTFIHSISKCLWSCPARMICRSFASWSCSSSTMWYADNERSPVITTSCCIAVDMKVSCQ